MLKLPLLFAQAVKFYTSVYSSHRDRCETCRYWPQLKTNQAKKSSQTILDPRDTHKKQHKRKKYKFLLAQNGTFPSDEKVKCRIKVRCCFNTLMSA